MIRLLWVGLLAGCAGRGLFYEPVGFWEAESAPLNADLLPWVVADHLERGHIESIAVAGPEGLPPRVLQGAEVEALPEELLFAAHATSTRRSRGGEYDMLVRGADRIVPVTVYSSTSGALVLARGEVPPAPRPPPEHGDAERWRAELARAYGLAAIEDGTARWSLVELGDLATALERLSEEERRALQGMVLGRQDVSQRSPRRELAFYEPRVHPPRIDFFDVAFDAFDSGFVGPVQRPLRAPVMTLLHEFGHALADHPLRLGWDAYVALDEAWREAAYAHPVDLEALGRLEKGRRAAARNVRRMGVRGPVIDGFSAARGNQRGPTSWAWRRVHESFAEAFALFHADPDALLRVMPEVHAWFAAGGHVAWAPPASSQGDLVDGATRAE